jgi:hypothetical protein
MTTDFKRLSLVVHGTPKIGKSWLGESCPGPVLIIDGEGSTDFLHRKHKTYWNPAGPPPTTREDGTPLGDDDLVIVKTVDWGTVNLVNQWVLAGAHPFRSLVLDTLTEIQKKAKFSIASSFDDHRQWGQLLEKMEMVCKQWRDLLDTQPQLFCVLILSQTDAKGKGDNIVQRPDVQGALSRSLGSFFDIIGYYRSSFTAGQLLPGRELVIAPYPGIEAGDRTDVLSRFYYPNGIIPEPDITQLIRLLNQEVPA